MAAVVVVVVAVVVGIATTAAERYLYKNYPYPSGHTRRQQSALERRDISLPLSISVSLSPPFLWFVTLLTGSHKPPLTQSTMATTTEELRTPA